MVSNGKVGFRAIIFNPLTLMVVIFGLPFGVSWYMFYSGDTLVFETGKSEGKLISPVRKIPDFEGLDLNGNKVGKNDLINKWTMLMVGPPACEKLCQDTLLRLRQVRLALAVDRRRVQRVWLLSEGLGKENLKELVDKEHQGLTVFEYDKELDASFSQVLWPDGAAVNYAVFLIDPLGNLMMEYVPATDGKKVLKDVERLLKYSDLGK